MFFLVFLFFSKDIFSKNRVFAPLDLVYSYHPWGDYKQVPFQNFQQVDALCIFIPWRLYGYEQMRDGHFPLYNPYEYGGAPFFANDQSAVLSPYNLIGLVFDFDTGFLIIAMLKLLVAAAGMYLFLSLFDLNKPSRILGTISYTFSALMILWLYHPVSGAVSFMPLLFWAGERLLRCADAQRAYGILSAILVLACIVAVSFLSGHSETAVNVSIGIVLYMGASILIKSKSRMQTALYAGIALMLGVLLASVQIIPFLQLLMKSAPLSYRSFVYHQSSHAQGSYLPLNALLTWFVPNLWGNPSYSYFTSNRLIYIFERYTYIGIAPLLLGLTTLRSIRTDYKRLLPFWIMILIGFGMAYGIPVFSWLTALPLMKAGSSARYVFLMEFGFSALSAFGLHALTGGKRGERPAGDKNMKSIALVVILSVLSIALYLVARYAIGIAAGFFSTVRFSGAWSWMTPGRLGFIVIQILIAGLFLTGTLWLLLNAYKKRINTTWIYSGFILLTIVDLFILGVQYNPDVSRRDFYPETPIIRKLNDLDTKNYSFYAPGDTLPTDTAMVYHLRDFRGYDVIVSERYQQFLYLLFPKQRPLLGVGGWLWWTDSPDPLIAALAGIKYFIFPKGFDPNRQGNYFTLIGTYDTLSLWDNELARPIVYAASRVIPSDNDADTLNILSRVSLGDIGSAIVQGADGYHVYNPDTVRLRTIEDRPGLYKLMVRTGSGGFLVFNQSRYPGWHAFIDKKAVPLYPVNYLFQGIELPAGRYTVTFHYMPRAFLIGLYLTIAAVLMVLVSAGLIGIKRLVDDYRQRGTR